MLFYVAFTTLFAIIIAGIYAVKSTRDVDIISFVVTLMMKSGLVTLLHKFGLTKRMRPECVELTSADGFKYFATSTFQYILPEVSRFQIRDDDVFIVTYPKAGTTWLQEIVWLLCNNVDVDKAKLEAVHCRVPFLESVDLGDDMKGLQSLEKWPQNKERLIKTHLPFELLPDDVKGGRKCKMIYLARNPKDLCVSFFHFHRMKTGMPASGTWSQFLTNFCNGKIFIGNWFHHNLTYWKKFQEKDHRLYFTTYENLKKDFKTEVAGIAKFLGKEPTDDQLDTIARHCSFDSMSKNKSTNYSGASTITLDFTKSKFMRKGQVGDWKNHFTLNQNSAFDELYEKEMKGSGLDIPFEL